MDSEAVPENPGKVLCSEYRTPFHVAEIKANRCGHIPENVVYLEFLRRGYDVYVGKIDSFEVDFVAQNSKGTWYYQVALSVRDEKTLERELRPLMSIRDRYPKMILTLDDDPEAQYDGIRRINARDWLLGLTDN